MTLGAYIWGMRLIVILSLSAFIMVISFVDPDTAGLPGKMLFYLSLFFALSGLFNLFLLWLRKRLTLADAKAASFNIRLSFRQGILLSIFAVGLLVMQSFRVLVWWDGLLLLVGIFLIELYFLSRE